MSNVMLRQHVRQDIPEPTQLSQYELNKLMELKNNTNTKKVSNPVR